MTWRQRLNDILWDQMIEQGGLVDLNMAVAELRAQCPGDFAIEWKSENRVDFWERMDADVVDIQFADDRERVEWLLKWS